MPTPAVMAGVRVPPQADTWSCGVNGAARALAMVGAPVTDVGAFVGNAPRMSILGIAIGPPPAALAAYACRARAQATVGTFDGAASLADSLRAGWQRGEPSLVLTRPDSIQLHWVLALGVAADGQVGLLDADGQLKSLRGGVDALVAAADLSQSLGFQMNLLQAYKIGRFNAISFAESHEGRPIA